jgi:hypothetical protein
MDGCMEGAVVTSINFPREGLLRQLLNAVEHIMTVKWCIASQRGEWQEFIPLLMNTDISRL